MKQVRWVARCGLETGKRHVEIENRQGNTECGEGSASQQERELIRLRLLSPLKCLQKGRVFQDTLDHGIKEKKN